MAKRSLQSRQTDFELDPRPMCRLAALVDTAKRARDWALGQGWAMSALGHVWTAPWQELSDVAAAFGRVRSRVRPVCAADLAAGPNALRGSGPNRKHAL